MPRLPPSAADAAFSVVKLDGEEVQARDRLDQALSQSPGVSLFRRTSSLAANPTTQGISLRSFAPSGAGRALVTLDGVPQNDPFGGWVIWTGLPTALIDNVTIVRGGGAGPYGAGALTGVISLQERTGHIMEASAEAGELGSYRGSLVAETSLGGLDVLVGGSGGKTDGYVPVRVGAGPADTPLAENDWSGAVRLTGAVGSTSVSARYSAFYEDRESGLAGASARATGQSASLTFGQAPTPTSIGFRGQVWARTSDLSNSSVAVAPPRIVTTPANNQYKTPATGYGLNAAIRGGDAKFEWEFGADARAATGEDREQFTFTAGRFVSNRVAGGDSLVAGIYSEMTQKLDNWLFTGGLRYDYWSNSNAKRIENNIATGVVTLNSPSPDRNGYLPSVRLGARRETGWGYLRAAAYNGFRPASLNELHRPFRVGNITTQANPALRPELLAGAEVGAGVTGDQGSADVTVFYNKLSNAITNVTIGVNTRQRQNAGTIEAWGVEGEASWKMNASLQARVAGTYTDATTDTNLRPAQAPRLTLTAMVVAKPTAAIDLRFSLRYEGDRFDDDQNLIKLAPAMTADLRAGWTINRNVEVYAAVDNVFDRAVENGQTSGPFNYASPRIASVGLTVRR